MREETGITASLITKLTDIRYVYVRSWGDGERVFKIVSFYLLRYESGRIDDVTPGCGWKSGVPCGWRLKMRRRSSLITASARLLKRHRNISNLIRRSDLRMPSTPHIEKHFTAGLFVRDVVIGMADGLTVPFALAAGLSGAVSSTRLIVIGGVAEIAAGSIAMGLGGYLAAKGDAEHYAQEKLREEREIIEIRRRRRRKSRNYLSSTD